MHLNEFNSFIPKRTARQTDGKNKFKTTIGDYAFIGSNTTLIAPVNLGERSAIAAGSTINQDVPDYDLGIARGRQSNLKEYSKKMPYNQ